MTSPLVSATALPFPLVTRGKVRDVYATSEDTLLIVATDRLSAFDVVMAEPVPCKGEVLTKITHWWLKQLEPLVPHHLISIDPDEIVARHAELRESRDVWSGRAMLVRRTDPIPVECVVRGYLSGSAWKEYRAEGTLAGESLPPGLHESDRFDPPIFSPATKAAAGHDENIPFSEVVARLGDGVANRLRELSLAIYEHGRSVAERAGVIVADTKFEFGFDRSGALTLIDEVLTPDSSRFWPADAYSPGGPQPSFDKQPVRDCLESLVAEGAWNREPPPPPLPEHVVAATTSRYREIFHRLTGAWPETYANAESAFAPPRSPGPRA